MKPFTPKQIVLLGSHGVIPVALRHAWQAGHARAPVSEAISRNELAHMWGFLGIFTAVIAIFFLGIAIGISGIWSMDLRQGIFIAGFASLLSASACMTSLTHWNSVRGAFGTAYARFLTYTGAKTMDIALMDIGQLQQLAYEALYAQAKLVKGAEEHAKEHPASVHAKDVAYAQRIEFKKIFDTMTKLGLVSSKEGWDPYLGQSVASAASG